MGIGRWVEMKGMETPARHMPRTGPTMRQRSRPARRRTGTRPRRGRAITEGRAMDAREHGQTAESAPAIRFGAMEGILRRSGGELVKVARQIGFDGVELNLREADPL